MTVQEAIKIAEQLKERTLAYSTELALNKAIECMGKQIPKKPNFEQKDSMGNPIERCPNCLSFGVVYYCANCGQKLDWEEGGTSESV